MWIVLLVYTDGMTGALEGKAKTKKECLDYLVEKYDFHLKHDDGTSAVSKTEDNLYLVDNGLNCAYIINVKGLSELQK